MTEGAWIIPGIGLLPAECMRGDINIAIPIKARSEATFGGALVNAMSEKNKFALVARSPGALEKAEPGAKRILSGMVTETLALAKKEPSAKSVFIVLIGDKFSNFVHVIERLIEMELGHRFDLRFISFDSTAGLLRAADEQPFDLICLNVDEIDWYKPTDGCYDTRLLKGIEMLARLKAKYSKPLFFMSGRDSILDLLRAQLSHPDVVFLRLPFKPGLVWNALYVCLGTSCDTMENLGEIATRPHRAQPPRIVVVDEDSRCLELTQIIIRDWLKNVTILTFQNGSDAFQELLQGAPDLLIANVNRPEFFVWDVLPLLAEKNRKYPILVTSGKGDAYMEKLLRARIRT